MHSCKYILVSMFVIVLILAENSIAATQKPVNEQQIWQQRWSKTSSAERQWAFNTGSCESGNNPKTNTGNGYLGAFQYDAQTWWAAPATGQKPGEAHLLPHEEPWIVQAVVSIKKKRHEGTGAWPVCG